MKVQRGKISKFSLRPRKSSALATIKKLLAVKTARRRDIMVMLLLKDWTNEGSVIAICPTYSLKTAIEVESVC